MNEEPLGRAHLETLLRVHEEAREAGHHETSYHALAAAAHAAEDVRDDDALAEVEARCRAHLAWLDERDPEHRLAGRPSRRRGHPSVFEQLALTTAGMRLRLTSERRLRAFHEGAARGARPGEDPMHGMEEVR